MPLHISFKQLNCFANSKSQDVKSSPIDTHIDPALAQTAKAKADEIGKQLGAGSVIIGESHDNMNARVIVEELIHDNKVKNLFLEHPDLSCDTFGGREDELFSQHLNKLTKSQLKSDPVFGYFSRIMKGGAIIGSESNRISIPDLVLAAREGNAKVHLIDNIIPKSKSIIEKSQERNLGMGMEFSRVSNYSKPGGVILVGVDHCSGGPNSLQAKCGIADHFVHDFSR